jgi:hypothetical protein
MAGGLLQLSNYNAQDIFLTGNPQVTFFKSVYRRHTNFAIETVDQFLQGDQIDFSKELLCTVEKNGDLIWNVQLVVDLPKVRIPRDSDQIVGEVDIKADRLAIAKSSYEAVHNFIGLMMQSYRIAIPLIQTTNSNSISLIRQQITSIYLKGDVVKNGATKKITEEFYSILERDSGSMLLADQTFAQLDFQSIVSLGNPISGLRRLLDDTVEQLIKIEKRYWASYQTAKLEYESAAGIDDANLPGSGWAKFAWIERLGHYITEYVDVLIGGQRIDRQYGDWINIWWELSRNVDQDAVYAKMIGDVDELTSFSIAEKPAYRLIVPLPFWFCRDNGLALPLVALSYYDVQFVVKFRDMEQCCYTDGTGYLDPAIVKIADARLWVDYVYLDAAERRRFAQSSHEYLIQQVQMEEYTDFALTRDNFFMHFSNPCRELVVVYQRDDLRVNEDDTQQCQFHNYTLDRFPQRETTLGWQKRNTQETLHGDRYWYLVPNRDEITMQRVHDHYNNQNVQIPEQPRQPFLRLQLTLNQYTRCPNNEPVYFQNVQPYVHHSASPLVPGINVFSFATKPELTQPSSSCNMSRLDKAVFTAQFNSTAIHNGGDPIRGRVRIYATSTNILRFMGGVAGLAFVYGE